MTYNKPLSPPLLNYNKNIAPKKGKISISTSTIHRNTLLLNDMYLGIFFAYYLSNFNKGAIMKKTNLSVAIALLATSTVSIATDEDNSFYGFTPSASVALTTDYMWRGVSQTNNDPAIQGSFDLAHESGLYVGAWASNVEFGDGETSMELDVYAGFSKDTDFGGILPFAFTYDLGILQYVFSASSDSNLTELYFGGSISPIERLNISTYYYYGLKLDHRKPGEYTDFGIDYTLPDSFGGITLLAHAGYYNQKDNANFGDDYWDWKIGIAKDLGGFNFEVAYHDTDNEGGGNVFGAGSGQSLNDGRIVATISRELGGNSSSAMLPDSLHSSASVALTTDYIWRGVSQTNNEPAIQGSFDLSHESGAYVGIWASSYEFQNESSMEVDMYAGFSKETDLGGFLPIALTYDIGWLRYEYTSAADAAPNFNEIYFGLAASPIENLNVSTYYYYGIKAEHVKPGEYTDMAIDYTLPDSLANVTLLAHAGYYNQKGGGADNYWDWKVGAAKDFSVFNIEVAYTDTDDADARNPKGRSLDDGKVVATISTTF